MYAALKNANLQQTQTVKSQESSAVMVCMLTVKLSLPSAASKAKKI